MTPGNSVFRGIYKLCKDIHPNTTDYIDGTEEEMRQLPVVYVGELSMSDSSNKDLIGTVNQTIHIYGTLRQRQELDVLVGRIRNEIIRGIPEYNYGLSSPKVNIRTLGDNSMGQTLLHIVMECSVVYNKKR